METIVNCFKISVRKKQTLLNNWRVNQLNKKQKKYKLEKKLKNQIKDQINNKMILNN